MSPQHETFAQARFSGRSVMDACRAAGYQGDQPQAAARISQHPDVKARIMELHNAAATVVAYHRLDAINDLLAIIHSRPCDASEENPLCERRVGRHGPYHRFPSKLKAMARLLRIMGWNEPPDPEDEQQSSIDPMESFLEYIRKRDSPNPQPDPDGIETPRTDTPPPAPAEPLPPQQETFAQARLQGMKVMEAYRTAGYHGDSSDRAFRVNQHPPVKARLAYLRQAAEAAQPYRKHHAINDLIAIIQASPHEASPENPLCEMRMSHEGPYYRFPCKLEALQQLIRLQRWHEPEKPQLPPGVKPMTKTSSFLAYIAARK